MAKRYAVILAAGQGTRMKSNLYKVLHPVVGRPMVNHVIQQLKKISLSKLVTIVGHGAEKVKDAIGEESTFAVQKEQLGTGHAVMQAEKLLKNKQGTTIVVCGDTPLITHQTYEALFQHHEQTEAKATILTTIAKDPTGYGRIIRNNAGEVERIVEHKDANEQELAVTEVNTGTYCFDNELLFKALKEVSNDNAQGEYYLPDVIEILKNKSEKISAYQTMDFDETLGINDRVALAKAEQIMRRRINEYHMRQGVTLVDPSQTYIGLDVTIGQDAIIYPGAMITGKTTIGSYTTIGPQVEINNCQIGNHVNIQQSVLEESVISDYTEVGPYAYIRPGSHIEAHARIGRFVEVKKSKIGQNSKIPHLSYIGDAHIGENVNIGCGTITVNYDGIDKHATIIEDHAFVGCNSNLVAPVTIGKGSYVAAGSTITRDVPEDALGIARSRQSNKENYAKRLRNREHN